MIERSARTVEHEAYELLLGSDPAAQLLLSCEHASLRLPPGWDWPDADRRLVGTHWSVDIGAAEFTRELAELTGASAVLARFSRLLIDPNRALDSATLFREWAEGMPVDLNVGITADDRARRIDEYYRPFHDAFDALVRDHPAAGFVFSVHSFTPEYEGTPRELEVGILHDSQGELAHEVCSSLVEQGYDARVNEPWSGLNGLMFSAETHAGDYGRRALELEIRQDLASDPAWRAAFAVAIVQAFRDAGLLTA